jgi:hypothetical protein
MDRKTLTLFISTLVVGMFTGAYFYVTVFAPAYKNSDVATTAGDPNAVTIEGQMNGACVDANTCASFKLSDNGSFDYLAYPGAKVRKGTLADASTRKLFSSIGTLEFFDDAKPIAVNACASHPNTVTYAYTVTLGGKIYILDTCATAFASDTQLQMQFAKVWPALQNPTSTYPVIIKEGLFGSIFYLFQHPQSKN